MVAIAKPKEAPARFPESDIINALEKWWKDESVERSGDPFGDESEGGGILYDLLPSLDSLTVVRSLLVIEKILTIEIPVSLVKRGGYETKEEMLEDLVPKLRRHYDKKFN
jgi:hypothetical protein